MTTLEPHLLLRGVSYAALCLLEGVFEAWILMQVVNAIPNHSSPPSSFSSSWKS
jgi:hypothetical protein